MSSDGRASSHMRPIAAGPRASEAITPTFAAVGHVSVLATDHAVAAPHDAEPSAPKREAPRPHDGIRAAFCIALSATDARCGDGADFWR